MAKPYRKLAILTKLSAVSILVSMFLSLAPFFVLLIVDKDKLWVGGVLFCAIWMVLCILDYVVCKRLINNENRKRGKYLTLITDGSNEKLSSTNTGRNKNYKERSRN